VLSDLWLDRRETIEKLEQLFGGYEAAGAALVGSGGVEKPAAAFFTFVLCGDFSSPDYARGSTSRTALASLFRSLAQLLAKFATLRAHAHFVFVPGPDDPTLGSADVLPRSPLPRALCSALDETLAHAHFTSNPARLTVCGKQMVILREDLLARLRRCTLLPPNEEVSSDLNKHMIETLVCQAHVCPLQMSEAAVYWRLDPALWLHPAPDVLVLAERSSQYDPIDSNGTLAFNPGSFSAESSWMVYRPGFDSAEPSSLN